MEAGEEGSRSLFQGSNGLYRLIEDHRSFGSAWEQGGGGADAEHYQT